MSSRSPISEWGELALSEGNPKWPASEQKATKLHTFGVLILSDPLTDSTTHVGQCVLVPDPSVITVGIQRSAI